jgi:hypothetical protein
VSVIDKLRNRPFDFYVAFVLFMFGVGGFVDPHWPEDYVSGVLFTIVTIIDVYLIVASLLIISSLLCKRQCHPVLAIMGEMYGWLFISAASLAIFVIYIAALYNQLGNMWILAIWALIWAGMAISSGLRSLDLLYFYRSLSK